MMYSLPSMRTLPAAFASAIEPVSSRSLKETISALMKPFSKSVWITPAAWGAFQAKAARDAEMQQFVAAYTNSPSATQVESFMLDEPLSGVPGAVYNVFVWQPYEGRTAELFAQAAKASAIHKKAGAGIAINRDQLGRMHYVMSFDSWTKWGEFQDNPTADWAEFMASFQANPPGKIVDTYMSSQLP